MAAPVDERTAELARVAEHLQVPDGYRVEVIGREIVVSPPTPSVEHSGIASALHIALAALLPTDQVVLDTVTLEIEPTGERYIPDRLVLPRDVARDNSLTGSDWLRPAARSTLVVEITSPSNAVNDRVLKLRGYAVGQVPLYLLVEPAEQSVTLFSDPVDGLYQVHVKVRFGAILPLPEPFTGDLDTGKLM